MKAPSEERFWPAALDCARGQMCFKIPARSQSPSVSGDAFIGGLALGWGSSPGNSYQMSPKAKG